MCDCFCDCTETGLASKGGQCNSCDLGRHVYKKKPVIRIKPQKKTEAKPIFCFDCGSNIVTKTARTKKNYGRKFKVCSGCNAFIGWVT